MGTHRTDYLMWGTDIGATDFDRDKYEAECDGAPHRRFDMVYDGMCGQYCIAGKIIARSDGPFKMVKIGPENLAGINPTLVAAIISEALGRKILANEFSLILFTHFS